MNEKKLTMFYPTILSLVFGACDAETQNAIALTSREWHRIMFNVRENKAKTILRSLVPGDIIATEKSLQQQCFEKLRLLDLRAKRLADWFTATPPNPEYTGKLISIGTWGFAPQDFSSFAAVDLDQNVFHDEQFFPHIIIDRAIKKHGFCHTATCPLGIDQTILLEVLVRSSMPMILKSYLEHFHMQLCINANNRGGVHLLQVAKYTHTGARRKEVMKILTDYGASIEPERLEESQQRTMELVNALHERNLTIDLDALQSCFKK